MTLLIDLGPLVVSQLPMETAARVEQAPRPGVKPPDPHGAEGPEASLESVRDRKNYFSAKVGIHFLIIS